MSLLRLVIVSDTHGLHRQVTVPEGDIFIHAGDLSNAGGLADLDDVNCWLGELPHRYKLVIAGNHDLSLEGLPAFAAMVLNNATYLEDQAITIEGLTFYGSPWTPQFFDWAFMLPRGEALRAKWAQIPQHTDVLITHGPPHGIGDQTTMSMRAGCEELRVAVEQLRPRLHIFGHIHEAAGVTETEYTTFINASVCTTSHAADNPPVVIDLTRPRAVSE